MKALDGDFPDPTSPPATLLGLPGDALLCVLQRVDALAVLRVSLCSRAAAQRLHCAPHFWEEVARRALLLPPPSLPLPSQQAGSSGAGAGGGDDDDGGVDGARNYSGGGTGGPIAPSASKEATTSVASAAAAAADSAAASAAAALTGADASRDLVAGASPIPSQPPLGIAPSELAAAASVTAAKRNEPRPKPSKRCGDDTSSARISSSSSLLSGSGSDGHRFWAALKAHARFAFWHSRHSLRLSRVSGSPPAPQQPLDGAWRAPPRGAFCCCCPARTGAVDAQDAPPSVPSLPPPSLSGAAGLGPDAFRLSEWELYGLRVCDGSDISVHGLSARCFSVRGAPSGAPCRLLVVAAWRGRPLAWMYFPTLPLRPSWQDQELKYQQQQQHQQLLLQQRTYEREQQRRHCGQRPSPARDLGGLGAGAVAGGGAGAAPAAARGHVPEVWVCREAVVAWSAAASAPAPRPTADLSVGVEVAARVRLLAAAGLQRLRCVGAVAVASRRQLREAGMAADLGQMRAAGVAVVDMAGVLPLVPGAPPTAVARGGGGGAGGVGVGGAGADAALSSRLREAVAALPLTSPNARVLLLPVVMPRGGRAGIRTTPSRGGGGGGPKCSAPRLLQLMVPVLSELRLAMSGRLDLNVDLTLRLDSDTDGDAQPPRLAQLQRVVLVTDEGGEDGPQATALRNLAVSTLDRGTGLD